MARYRISEIKLNIGEEIGRLPSKIASKIKKLESQPRAKTRRAGVKASDIKDVAIVRRSIDARKGEVVWVYTVDFSCDKSLNLPEPPDTTYVIPELSDTAYVIPEPPDTTYVIPDLRQSSRQSSEQPSEQPGRQSSEQPSEQPGRQPSEQLVMRPVVVGFGPCGMFCALVLAKAGLHPIVIERGDDVETRQQKVEEFWRTGKLDTESNVQFGEGGAGTFSDGKLNTGIKDPRARFVLETFAGAGADPDILIDARPHIGTDALRSIVKNIREEIISIGGEVRFATKLERVILGDDSSEKDDSLRKDDSLEKDDSLRKDDSLEKGDSLNKTASTKKVVGIEVRCKDKIEIIECDTVVLALGHSARDTVRALHAEGLMMEPKAFSMGVRVQHEQKLIDRGMYGEYAKFCAYAAVLGNADLADSKENNDAPLLPPAYYKLATRVSDGRGVYSFCMCPGGEIVNAASQEGGVVTNGMSNHDRDSGFANSGILVDVRPEDYIVKNDDSLSKIDGEPETPTAQQSSSVPPELAGIAFQEKYERLAFINGGGNYSIPTTTWGEYKNDTEGQNPVISSLPDFVARDIAEAMPLFGKKIKGFDNDDTVIKAIESRSSSPVRILRNKETLQADIAGIYPGGEGAGYAGGITSAACDGIRIAERIIARIKEYE